MIFDRLNNKELEQYYSLNNKFQKAFAFLKETDLENLKEGRYEIQGDEIFANVQSLITKNKQKAAWEVHREYIDIQYLIKGKECIGYGILEDFNEIITPYDNKKDIEFLTINHSNNDIQNKINYINITQRDFVILYPNDVHAPMLSVEKDIEIKKVIVKIKNK